MSPKSSGNDSSFKWLVSSIIALLAAGGGIVALLNYINPPQNRNENHSVVANEQTHNQKTKSQTINPNFDSNKVTDESYEASDENYEVTDEDSNKVANEQIQNKEPGLKVDLGELAYHFRVNDIEVQKRGIPDAFGRISEFTVLAFKVEAIRNFSLIAFKAQFYDSEGIEISGFSLVQFEPDYRSGWSAGTRSRAYVILPPASRPRLSTIKFSRFF